MKKVYVKFTPGELNPGEAVGIPAVVIDVLRATSTISTAIANGCIEVVPSASIEEAWERAKRYSRDDTLLGGERRCLKIEGFDLGNSPREYTRERIGDKRIILTTTNGTIALKSASEASERIIGSFLNLDAVYRYCASLDTDLMIICSGIMGRLAREDSVCAGMIPSRLAGTGRFAPAGDSGMAATRVGEDYKGRISEVFLESMAGKLLTEAGLEADLEACSRIDTLDVVPVMRGESIVNLK